MEYPPFYSWMTKEDNQNKTNGALVFYSFNLDKFPWISATVYYNATCPYSVAGQKTTCVDSRPQLFQAFSSASVAFVKQYHGYGNDSAVKFATSTYPIVNPPSDGAY